MPALLPGLSAGLNAGLVPQSSGGPTATITGYNAATGVVSGTAPPNLLVVVAIAGVYAASTLANASGAWSTTLSGANNKLLSVAAIPQGTFLAVGLPYSTFDPSNIGPGIALSNGNLTATGTSNTTGDARGTVTRSSGLLYFEGKSANTAGLLVGLCNASQSLSGTMGNSNSIVAGCFASSGGTVLSTSGSGTNTDNINAHSSDVIGVAVNFTAGTTQFYRNGAAMGSAISNPSGALYAAMSQSTAGGNTIVTMNFGASAFAYTPPSGYSAWG